MVRRHIRRASAQLSLALDGGGDGDGVMRAGGDSGST